MMTTRPRTARRQGSDVLSLTLTPDGRLRDEALIPRLLEAGRSATDCFVFCHGWPHDDDQAREEAGRFFALLDQAMAPLRDRVTPLRVALRWPARPLAEQTAASPVAGSPSRIGLVPVGLSGALARQVLEAEVPEGPEDEAELELLRRQLGTEEARTVLSPESGERLGLWLMNRRAGQVGARFGREYLSVLTGCVRTHLIGHALGGKLAASAVLAGARPESLTLLLGIFSAFAFAPAVPGFKRPGVYHALVAQRQVARPVVVLRSDHGKGVNQFSTLGPRGAAVPRPAAPGRGEHARTIVATSTIGIAGARGVGAPALTLAEVGRVGLPTYPVVNVDGSAAVKVVDPMGDAHGDIGHPAIATLILLAGGLLQGGPDGIRPPRLDPVSRV
jgi:hypothetical protein